MDGMASGLEAVSQMVGDYTVDRSSQDPKSAHSDPESLLVIPNHLLALRETNSTPTALHTLVFSAFRFRASRAGPGGDDKANPIRRKLNTQDLRDVTAPPSPLGVLTGDLLVRAIT